ncbi:unnamed protein product [Didymodactylos carnosus]|uniref:Uncharacterized protein n=1 Tax=Didymodactylos carnosus TaxID=1234261 RepID=A0A815I885_9BILA|nr:unnamed protein product [Didymodactylos carnosus]CAF1364422.1 unnamed protein product [Didymodactylos carnosus]CAF4143817.1 unnamed protein product [Didymodactylos carnosus]CAF4245486.1 unnamed protein product [Didymodactylos carnosus]
MRTLSSAYTSVFAYRTLWNKGVRVMLETLVVPSEIDYYVINSIGQYLTNANDEYLKVAEAYYRSDINKDFLHDIIHAVQDLETLLSQFFASTKGNCHLDQLLLQ